MEKDVAAEQAGWLQKNIQNQLAWAVFLVSTGGILIVAYWASHGESPAAARKEIFGVLVPLFGTWVGTILAFYFSRENFERANATVNRMVEKLTPEQELLKTAARQVMKSRSAIRGIVLDKDVTETTVTLKTLYDFLGKGLTRIPVFGPGDTIKYIILDSTLAKFVAERTISRQAEFDPATFTLAQFLAAKIADENVSAIVKKFAVVKTDVTLADARTAMLAIEGARDVFLTKNGTALEPVEGWLTNTDITRDL
jgi:hypothetical protein